MEEEEEEGEEEKKEEEEEEEEETEPNMDYYMDNMHEVEDDDEVWSTRASFDRYSLSGPKVYNSLKVLVQYSLMLVDVYFFVQSFMGGGGREGSDFCWNQFDSLPPSTRNNRQQNCCKQDFFSFNISFKGTVS